MASWSLVTDVGVPSVLTSCMQDCTALSAFPLHRLCEEYLFWADVRSYDNNLAT